MVNLFPTDWPYKANPCEKGTGALLIDVDNKTLFNVGFLLQWLGDQSFLIPKHTYRTNLRSFIYYNSIFYQFRDLRTTY